MSIQNKKLKIDKYLERTKRNHFWLGSPKGQDKIRLLKVGVAGLGGMGSNIAEMFVRLGVLDLRIADNDTIEASNINRQVIAFEDTISQSKAEASAKELRRVDSGLQLEVFKEGIQRDNVERFVKDRDVIINEIDVFHLDEQLLLIEAAHRQGICVYTTLVVGVGIHLYKYSPESNYSARDFLNTVVKQPTVENLIHRFAEPLPSYMQGESLTEFILDVKENGVPIFGASTYLGQSLLVIRVLLDMKILQLSGTIPKTPSLPQFLVLDPITLEFKVAEIGKNGTARFIKN